LIGGDTAQVSTAGRHLLLPAGLWLSPSSVPANPSSSASCLPILLPPTTRRRAGDPKGEGSVPFE